MSRFHHTPEWARARRERLDLDGWRCRQCGRAGRLEVHHIVSLKDNGNHALDNLITLCREHHLDIHRQPVTENQAGWAELISELMK